MSRDYTADIDPEAFAVVDGKLYVNYSTFVQARWRLDRAGNIAEGPRQLARTAGHGDGRAVDGGRRVERRPAKKGGR